MIPCPARITGSLGIVNQLQRLLVFFRIRRQIRTISRQLRLRGLPIEFACRLLRVLCDVDQHRPRPPRPSHIKCLANRPRNFAGMRHQIVVLRDGQRHAGDVGLLKRVRPDQLASNLTGNTNDRRRIEHRRRDPRHHIGRARPRSRDRNAHLPAGARISIRHVRGALLVTHQNVMDLAALERVIRRQNRAAGIAENSLHPFALNAFPHDARAGHTLGSRIFVSHGRCP